jgi:hypothetical protein
MSMDSDCETCIHLWQEYANAVHNHLHLDNKLNLALLQFDREKAATLQDEVDPALRKREVTRAAYWQHVNATHTPRLNEGA